MIISTSVLLTHPQEVKEIPDRCLTSFLFDDAVTSFLCCRANRIPRGRFFSVWNTLCLRTVSKCESVICEELAGSWESQVIGCKKLVEQLLRLHTLWQQRRLRPTEVPLQEHDFSASRSLTGSRKLQSGNRIKNERGRDLYDGVLGPLQETKARKIQLCNLTNLLSVLPIRDLTETVCKLQHRKKIWNRNIQ